MKSNPITESIYAIMFLYESGELTEGQATKLMNSGDRVSFRLAREKMMIEMKNRLAKDMELHGWKFQP